MHAQIVLCPGWNDGAAPRAHRARAGAAPSRRSPTTAIVPVGPHAPPRAAARAAHARRRTRRGALVDTRRGLAARASCATLGSRFVFLADEVYLQAGLPLPAARDVRGLRGRRGRHRPRAPLRGRLRSRGAPPARAAGAAPPRDGGHRRDVRAAAARAARRVGLDGRPRARRRRSPNEFFGRGIGVAGLLTGARHPAPARGARGPSSATRCWSRRWRVRDGDGVFLDDLTPADLAARARRARRSPSSRTPAALLRRAPWAGERRARRRRRCCARSSPSSAAPTSASPRSSTGSSAAGSRSSATCPASPATGSTARVRFERWQATVVDTGRLRSLVSEPPGRGRAAAGAAGGRGGRPRACSWSTRRAGHHRRSTRRSRGSCAAAVGRRRARGQQGGQRGARKPPLGELYRLGFGEPVPPSPPSTGAAWPSCSRSCRDRAPAVDAPKPRTNGTHVAVIGRPNVGKSSLVNAMLGARARAGARPRPAPRATRWTPGDLPRPGRTYVLVDTAGIRRKGKVTEALEKLVGGDGAQEPRAVPGRGARASTPPRA